MKHITAILMCSLVALCAVGQTMTDVDNHQHYGFKEMGETLDANFALLETDATLQPLVITNANGQMWFSNVNVIGTLTSTNLTTTTEAVAGSFDADDFTCNAAAGLDTKTTGTLVLGAVTADAIDIGKTTEIITLKGPVNTDEAVTMDTTLGVTGPSTLALFASTIITTNAYTITSADYGTMIVVNTNTAVALTLPANGAAIGSWVDVATHSSVSDSCIPTIATATADTLVIIGAIDGDSLTYGSGHRIGAYARFWSDGAFWHYANLGPTDSTENDSD